MHHGRVVKRTGDGALVEFRSVVDAVRCAVEVQNAMVERNAGLPQDRRIDFRIGIHLGDVVEESDGDLMGDGVNIAARLEGVAAPGAICLSEQAYWQVRGRLDLAVTDLGRRGSRTSPTSAGLFVASRSAGCGEAGNGDETPRRRKSDRLWPRSPLGSRRDSDRGGRMVVPRREPDCDRRDNARLSVVVLPFANLSGDPGQDYLADALTDELTTGLSRIRDSFVIARNTAFTYKGKPVDAKAIGKDLGVRYVLEGSVQPSGDQVRVNAQLIDAESGAHYGPSNSTPPAPICCRCRTRSSRIWRARLKFNFLRPRPPASSGRPRQIPTAEDLAMQCTAAY